MYSKEILGTRVDFDISMPEVLERIQKKYLSDGNCHYICTTNPEFIIEASHNPSFRSIINSSDLSLPDGAGVLFARRYLDMLPSIKKTPLYKLAAFYKGTWLGISSIFEPKKIGDPVTGVSLVHNMCSLSAKHGYTVFLLGGWPKDRFGHRIKGNIDLATITAAKLRQLYPGVNIIGATSKFTPKQSDDADTLAFIRSCMKEHNVSSIDFLFVAYNHMHQESWISRNSKNIPAKVSVGVGGTFDYISGFEKDSPKLFSNIHMGWLYRLVTQPWRLRRTFSAFPVFPLKIYADSLK